MEFTPYFWLYVGMVMLVWGLFKAAGAIGRGDKRIAAAERHIAELEQKIEGLTLKPVNGATIRQIKRVQPIATIEPPKQATG